VRTAFAPLGRVEFVRSIVDEFERNHLGVDESVVDYLLSAAVPAEEVWLAAIKEERTDIEEVRRALTDALEEAGRVASSRGANKVERSVAAEVFPQVLKMRWNCPYPLLLC
jgi:hypothetical protein